MSYFVGMAFRHPMILLSSSFVFDVVFRLLVGMSLPQQESMGSARDKFTRRRRAALAGSLLFCLAE